jgi:tripartite-type tricarboxylate transporter receptor subunit TctC
MTPIDRRRLLAATMALWSSSAGLPAWAAAAGGYPSRPIRFVDPFVPGGSADVMSRIFATKLSETLHANMFVENMGGAGGTIGADKVAKAAPDGYTLLLSNTASLAIGPRLYARVPYDPMRDFVHVAMFGSFPNVLVVGPDVKAARFPDFIAEARDRAAHGRPMTFGSAGNGSTPQLSAELLKQRTGIQAQHIPFKGGGPALLSVISGDVSFQFENVATAIPQLRAGKVRALGITSAHRIGALPEVPTMGELGVERFVLGSFYGISAPAGTPAPVVQTLRKTVVEALKDPALQSQTAEMGIELSAIPPEQYPDFIVSVIKLWGDLIKSTGARVD